MVLRSLLRLSPAFLALAFLLPASAQTQTYDVTSGSGTVTTPTRIYFTTTLSPFSLFLESGVGTGCGGQSLPYLGFISLNGQQFGTGVCVPLTSDPTGSCGQVSATFDGYDVNGLHFTGSVNFVSTCHKVIGRYTKTVYSITPDSGVLTIQY